ncbi:hypothetical protein DOK78_001225 [Enterococcus sp. DIV2402]|uniref:Uncharacterized protein n=1 Tax=Candidatus Enterococcus lowellii TaxID=2230877 RepID=A0ABZ2SL65_9ENTE|nr:hypothetical protein [Enterococcus sp. DIV2402]
MIKKFFYRILQLCFMVTLVAGGLDLLVGKHEVSFYTGFIGMIFTLVLLSSKEIIGKLGFWKIACMGILVPYLLNKGLKFFSLEVIKLTPVYFMLLVLIEGLSVLVMFAVIRKK